MKKTLALLGLCFFFSTASFAQDKPEDSSVTLTGVTIKAFEQNRRLPEVTASVNYISQSLLTRYNNTSILPALNATPGVRMEERSPGSYRMNIRGSTLRSPFGVRNVKIYWNDLPLTDPGGNTYLNQLAFYNFNSIEIIKGPGSSLYGSGSGGVILISSQPEKWMPGVDAGFIGGSYGLINFNTQVKFGQDDRRNIFNYTHQSSDGYRDHTNMRRDVVNWQTLIRSNEKQELKAVALYGDLYYQTPGGLTKKEYDSAARMARPKAGTLPSADTARAAIYQKTFMAGLSNTFYFCNNWENNSVVYGAFTSFKNPTFRTYEKRIEPHFGGRSSFKWKKQTGIGLLQVVFGGEAQKGFFNTKTFTNVRGTPGTVMTDDDLHNWTYFVFAQADLHLKKDWNITAGASINKSSVTITRLSVPSFVPIKRTYDNQLAPRIALSKRIIKQLWVYGSVSTGFSPPTVAELLPGTVNINTSLQPEEGTNYELGIKSGWLNDRLYVELTGFWYQLSNAIVVRKDLVNGDYYVNAGSTRQKGIETQVIYDLFHSQDHFINVARLQLSYTHYDFHYHDFKQGTNDFSGKQLPSVSPNTIAFLFDIQVKPGLYTNLTFFHSDRIALNDANTAYAASYNLIGGRLGWKKTFSQKYKLNLFVGAENLLNEKYSLGNDINAAGDRFYNVAAGRNYFAGVAFQWLRSPGK